MRLSLFLLKNRKSRLIQAEVFQRDKFSETQSYKSTEETTTKFATPSKPLIEKENGLSFASLSKKQIDLSTNA